jgi:hypothetical protein
MKRLCRITEAEVIAEFLKGEFYNREYDHDRNRFEFLVQEPDLNDDAENALRRALLFRRRASMWRELPESTQWWEIGLEPGDLERLNVFPRAQWRSIAQGNFRALHVAELVSRNFNPGAKSRELSAKIYALRTLMGLEGPRSTILLIGRDENQPVTVLEGNHRFVAALLLPREMMLRRLRIVCGFSQDMDRCCWYKTTAPNLVRYLKNRIQQLWTRKIDPAQFLEQVGRRQALEKYARSAGLSSVETE